MQNAEREAFAGFLTSLCAEYQKHNQIDPAYYERYNVKRGLRNADGTCVMAGVTQIGNVLGYYVQDGERIPADGRLIYRGIDVVDLVNGFVSERRFGFEETAYLLLFGALPTRDQLDRFCQLLTEHHDLPRMLTEDMIIKAPSPDVMNKLARSVLAGLPYPAALLEGVFVRIRAERKITRGKAAILKACYLKNPNSGCPKEVLTVALNKESKSIPYHLGRWFAVLEAIQQDANPGINSTIRDKYFSSASSTPAAVFALLIQLSQKHLSKLSERQNIYYNKLIQEIVDHLPDELPARLSLPEQASFILGYYHQTQDRYTKKED